jgi:hypothetical protein
LIRERKGKGEKEEEKGGKGRQQSNFLVTQQNKLTTTITMILEQSTIEAEQLWCG